MKKSIFSENSGTRLLVFGAVHGNEPCGPLAVNRILNRFESGELVLTSGEFSVVDVANPKAYELGKRYFEEDLNRVFRRDSNPRSYEAGIANELCQHIEEADAFLDIHSTAAPGPTCVFIDFPTPENIAFAEAMGVEYAITGWPEAYAHNPDGPDSYDTTRYAYGQGKIGILVECGQHTEAKAVDVAEQSILRALAHFGMIAPGSTTCSNPQLKTVRMERILYKEHDGDRFEKEWRHLEQIPQGVCIAVRASGERILAQGGTVMLLPKHAAREGQEWCYLGVGES